MTAGLLFLASSAAFWAGAACLLGGVWRWFASRKLGWTWVWGGGLLALAAGLPHDLGRAAPRLWVPLVWPVLSFAAWVVAFGLAGLVQALRSRANPGRPVARARADVALWALVTAVGVVWFILAQDRVQILRGAIPIEPAAALGLAAAAIGGMFVVSRLEQRLRKKRLAVNVARICALLLGSAVFSVPLFWLLLTSFKEQQDTVADRLVWTSQVTETHGYTDDSRPLVTTVWRGGRVWANVVSRRGPDLELEVERPFPLRGWRFTRSAAETQPALRHGIVVTARTQGQDVRAFVRNELVGGVRELEVLRPAALQGARFQARADETKAVRHPGVRWENYSEALEWLPEETRNGLLYARNTLWLVLATTLGTVLSCSLVAYGFSRVRFPGREALFSLLIATMMLPGAVTILPRFLLWRGLGAVDSLVPLWLPSFTASAFYVFLLRQFFKTVPVELEDAAKVDGCGTLRTYWQVMLPQVKPALAVIALWTVMGSWNDFMGPLIYVSSPEKMPLSYAIQLFSADKGGEFSLMAAFATMSTIPVLAVFFLGQRYFVEGVQLSGLGGK